MATWRCPHCATAQGESARCFLCGRSATSCGTCAHFRASFVEGVGYCALDRRHSPLSGAEQRACWTGADADAEGELFASAPVPAVTRRGEVSVVPLFSGRLAGD
jgi:hypothetical protein